MGDFHGLDGDLVARRIEARARPLRRPGVPEIPARLLVARLVDEDDRPVLSLHLSVDGLLPPFPQRRIVGTSPLQRDVRVLVQPGELARGEHLLISLAVLDGILRRIETRRLAESTPIDPVDLDSEIKSPI